MGEFDRETDGNSFNSFIDVIPAALAASKRRDALHETEEAAARAGRPLDKRTPSQQELREALGLTVPKRINAQPTTETAYDLSDQDGPTPNFRDLAKGGSSSRSQDFQTGRRVNHGESVSDRKSGHERRDRRNRPRARY